MAFQFDDIAAKTDDMIPEGYYVTITLILGEPYVTSEYMLLQNWYTVGEPLSVGDSYRVEISDIGLSNLNGCKFNQYASRLSIRLSLLGHNILEECRSPGQKKFPHHISQILWSNISLIKNRSKIIDLHIDYNEELKERYPEFLRGLDMVFGLVPLDITEFPSYNLTEGS